MDKPSNNTETRHGHTKVEKHDWMQKAVPKSHEGKFSEEAKRAGMSTHAYAEKKQHAPGKLGERARLALEFEKEAHG